MRTLVWLAATASLGSGCKNVYYYSCAAGDASAPDTVVADVSVSDGRIPDAVMFDAMPDGDTCDARAIDAAIDARPIDAAIDARPIDAAIDARPIDARPIDAAIDARPIDAAIDARIFDAPPPDAFWCPAGLSPTSDGSSAARQALMFSEISPGNYVQLWNNSGATISFDSSAYVIETPYWVVDLRTAAPHMSVPPYSYFVVPWDSLWVASDAGGEMILYLDYNTGGGDAAKVMDFVCWGTNPGGDRMSTAYAGGKWSSSSPTSCAPTLTNHAIRRLRNTDGVDAVDYDTTATQQPLICTP